MSIVPDQEPGAQGPAPQGFIARDLGINTREQLVNQCLLGPMGLVSIPEMTITSLHGIMLDFDHDLYNPKRLPEGATESPERIYREFVGPMLARHPVYAKSEVRDTGRGLHAIVRIRPQVKFDTEAARKKWSAVVKIVQHALPTDPHAPGITATTRPVGSINGKTGRSVIVLKEAEPVTADEILMLVAELQTTPFKTIAGMLLGHESPYCPVCAKPDSRLGVLDQHGTCYVCGKLDIAKLYDAFYAAPVTGGGLES